MRSRLESAWLTGAAPATLAWTYNNDFAPTSFTYAGGTQTYAYDADGLLTSAAPFTIARRADNALPTSVSAPGFALSRTYSPYGEIDSADWGAYSYTLSRDTAGRITQKAEECSGTVSTWGYAYDTLGRLTGVTLNGELAESYGYDTQGNRTEVRVPLRGIDTTMSASFDTEDRATDVGDATYTYTPDGYLAAKHSAEGTATYAYTAFGELARVELPGGRVVTYTYDASGRRTSKAIDSAVAERYVWADTTRLLAVMDGAGTLKARFLYADARVPYAADTPEGRIFFAFDQVGSLRAVTDEDGSVLKAVAHDSFGNVIEDSNPALEVPLGFAGGFADRDTGLVLFGARDYDPELGRWIAKDPIGFAGGDANLYGYCLGDPVGLVDPSGLYADAHGGTGPTVCPDEQPQSAYSSLQSEEAFRTPTGSPVAMPFNYYQDFNLSTRGVTTGVIWNRTDFGHRTESVYWYFGGAHGVSWPPWGSASVMYHEGRTAPGLYVENSGGAVGGAAVGTQIYDSESGRFTAENYTQEGGSTPSFGGQVFNVFSWDLAGLF